jgi:2-dehydro-3-deoxyphosphogluconate aldolase/(4S)-4-hydroxy-2-oxoglutarate aldolase
MDKAAVLNSLQESGLIPVLRASSVDTALTLAVAITDSGINVLEITMTIPGALQVIRKLLLERPNVLIGAGTVLDPETARICILEGAKFIVSPALNLKTIEVCQNHDIAIFPGALTPTEILTAWQAGADAIKVFPAGALGGPTYLASLKGPFPNIKLMPTGGVSLANAAEFLRAGAFALGVGSDLVNLKAIAAGKPEIITETAHKYRAIIREFRSHHLLQAT